MLPKFRYLSAWFCPYAHRATLALEHHAGAIDYDWVEALGWEQRKGMYVRTLPCVAFTIQQFLTVPALQHWVPLFTMLDEKNVTGTGKEWWYHWKVCLSAHRPTDSPSPSVLQH